MYFDKVPTYFFAKVPTKSNSKINSRVEDLY